MANTTMNESPLMIELASRIIMQIASFFESITVSPSYSIEEFPYDGAENYLYVLYSGNGMPLNVGTVTGSTGKRDQNRVNKEIQGFGASGYVASYRVLELGSEELTVQMGRIIMEMFRDALPLTTSAHISLDTETTEITSAAEPETPVRGRRGRPKKLKATKTGRRGRPKKSVVEATEIVAPRRRGRPRKDASEPTKSAAPVRKARSKKDETSTATNASQRRRGRPKKSEAAAVEGAAPRRRGRPKKSEATAVESAAPRRRGRPKQNAPASADVAAAPRRGRPSNIEIDVAAPAAPKARRRLSPAKKKAASKGGGAKSGGDRKAAATAPQTGSGEGESQTA